MSQQMRYRESGCSQAAILMLDLTAAILVASGVALAVLGSGGEAADRAGNWTDLAFAAAGGTLMVGAVVAAMLRRPDEDEYARRLLGQATMIGFYVTLTAFIIWLPLAGAWVAAPTSDQLMGLLLAATGLGYFIARVRGVW